MSSPTASGAWPIPDLTTLGVFCAAPDVGDEECLTSLLAHIQQSTDSHLALMHFVCYDAPDWIMLRKVYPTSAYTHGPYRQGFDVPIGSEGLPADRRSVAEAHETFRVILQNAVGATLGDAEGIGTILNDDGRVHHLDDDSEVADHSDTAGPTLKDEEGDVTRGSW